MKSEQLESLAKALASAQSEFPAIAKDANNPFFKSKYADLSSVVQTASPILTKHGLSVSQFPGYQGDVDVLTTYLLHDSGQYIAETMKLHLNKQDAQGQGSAMTYARRYSYMAVLGLVADEDDDGNAASNRGAQRNTPAPKPPQKDPEPPTRNVKDEEPVSVEIIGALKKLLTDKGMDVGKQDTVLDRFSSSGFGVKKAKDMTQAQARNVYVTIREMDAAALLQLTEG